MRISDWSSDVCSSDLRRRGHRDGDIVDILVARIAALRRRKHQPSGHQFEPGKEIILDRGDGRPALRRQLDGEQRPALRTLDQQARARPPAARQRSEEHTSELQSLMRISYAVFCSNTNKTSPTSNDLYPDTPIY